MSLHSGGGRSKWLVWAHSSALQSSVQAQLCLISLVFAYVMSGSLGRLQVVVKQWGSRRLVRHDKVGCS